MAVDFFIHGTGWHQGDLIDILANIVTKFNATLTKLDADGTVTDTNYNALGALTIPATIQTVDPKCIRDQGELVTLLDNMITKFNATLVKLDADAGVTDTNYNALWAIVDVVGLETDSIKGDGVYMGCVVRLLQQFYTNYAGMLAKLDLDAGVADTNYGALGAITDNIDENGTVARVL